MRKRHGSNGKGSSKLSKESSDNHEDPLSYLPRRKREVAHLICQGKCNKEISIELGISGRTVKAHLSSMYLKFGVSDRLQLALHLVRRAISAGETTSKSS